MKISELLKEKATISFEVFPPKNKEGDISSIYYTIEELAKLDPDFISVTYGAGGSSKGERPWRSHRPLKISIRSSP